MKNLQIGFALSALFLISACSTETTNKHQDSMDLATSWGNCIFNESGCCPFNGER